MTGLFAEAKARAQRLIERKRAAEPDVLTAAFPEQRAFITDESKLKVGFCTRRAAKSFSFGLECIRDSRDWPTGNYLFLGLVRQEAKRIFWKDVLKAIDKRFGLNIRFNESDLTATMPNGATIYIGAADANEQEMRKLLGQKYRKIAIDEAQDWQHTDLEELVFHVLKPACADFHGSIELLGTPGKIGKGFFRQLTPRSVAAGKAGEKGPDAAGWSVHCWDTFSNTSLMADGRSMHDHWVQEIAELRAMKPGIDETPWFRRNYLGEWVVEDDALVYRYQPGRNDFDGKLPLIPGRGRWHFILGIDLGHKDPTAYTLWAFHDFDPNLYGLDCFKQPGMDITDASNRAKEFDKEHDVDVMVIDGSNKQAVAEMSNRHGLTKLQAADKTGKPDFIELMNADFVSGRIKLSPKCQPLKDEYASLIWNDKAMKDRIPKKEEHPACENHAADSGLYGWRYCYQYLSREAAKLLVPGSDEWAKAQHKQMFARAQEDVRRGKAQNAIDDWGGLDDWGVE